MTAYIYDLAIVEDRGSYYQVLGLQQNTYETLLNNTEKYVKLSSSAYQEVDAAIKAGKSVRLPKSTIGTEYLPGEVNAIDPGLDDVGAAKEAAKLKIRSLVNHYLAKMSGFIFYEFISLNNELVDAGFVITKANREEKYIEIIETGDVNLISNLERYLSAKDEIEKGLSIKYRLDAFVTEVDTKTTVEEVNAVKTQFLTDFYANA